MSQPSLELQHDERRTERRLRVRLPVAVRGKDASGAAFDERTTSENVCRGGLMFTLTREISVGVDLEITIPLPQQGREGEGNGHFETSGRVRHAVKNGSGTVVGVEFTGPRFYRLFLTESPTQA